MRAKRFLLLLIPAVLLFAQQKNSLYNATDESPFQEGPIAVDLGHGGKHSDCPTLCRRRIITGPTKVVAVQGKEFSINFRIDEPGGLGSGNEMKHSGGNVSWGDGTYSPFQNGPIPGNNIYTGLVSFNQTLKHTYQTAASTYTIRAYMQGDFKISDDTGSCSYRCRAVATVPVTLELKSKAR